MKIKCLFLRSIIVILFVGQSISDASAWQELYQRHSPYSSSGVQVPNLDLQQAKKIFELPVHCIEVEFPNKLGQALGNVEDLKRPKDLRPIFYGCFDWHSSVHGYWSIVRLMKTFSELDADGKVRDLLNRNITESNAAIEKAFFEGYNNRDFERTYGWAWFLQLQSELYTWQDEDANRWYNTLKPLEDLLVEKYKSYLPKLYYPIRTGQHDNTAFGLSLSIDYARTTGNKAFEAIIQEHAKRLYLNDVNCNLAYEPSGNDFLSPCLEEALLMSKVLETSDYRLWLTEFLPSLFDSQFDLTPGKVSDRSDGKLVHLDGLNFSRATCLYGITKKLPELNHLKNIALIHLNYSIHNIVNDDYMGSHWLGSFALYALMNVTMEASMENTGSSPHFIRRMGVEAHSEYIFPTNPFLKGENHTRRIFKSAFSAHLKYAFQFQPNTYADRIYGGAYQGVGLACYTFGDSKQLGDPMVLYLFQGARLARFSRRISFNYEWNLGASWGWNPYDQQDNSYNLVIGSRVNAYINAQFYLNWALSRQFDLHSGITLTHFSNGNTKIPNAGLNTSGLKIGLAYNFNRTNQFLSNPAYQSPSPEFPRHISYDLTLFGSWRRKGVAYEDQLILSPTAYTVMGFNFAPMYNFGYKFRAGVSLDGVYDESANVYTQDYIAGTTQEFLKPALSKQLALGLSGRAEYVMPYFSIGLGLGVNVLHDGSDLDALYQILALKTEITRNSFIHIGYSLQNFHNPNFLMLGIGYRFNNNHPSFRK